jgi:ankyrin repeat protein
MVSTALPRGGWTPLMHAARQGAFEGARAIADAGADLDARDPDGTTALVLAIINAHYDLAAMLLDKGADPNVADSNGMAAVYALIDMHTLAPMQGRPAPKLVGTTDAATLLAKLIAHGGDPNARLLRPVLGRHHGSGDPALGEGSTPFLRAAKTVDLDMMRLLLDVGADPALTRKDRTTALTLVAGGRVGGFPARTAEASTALTIEALKLCLDRGLDIDAFSTTGQTALHAAAGRGADDVVQFLADNGATLDLPDKQGRTPLDIALGVRTGGRAARNAPTVHETTAALLRQLMADRGIAQPGATAAVPPSAAAR